MTDAVHQEGAATINVHQLTHSLAAYPLATRAIGCPFVARLIIVSHLRFPKKSYTLSERIKDFAHAAQRRQRDGRRRALGLRPPARTVHVSSRLNADGRLLRRFAHSRMGFCMDVLEGDPVTGGRGLHPRRRRYTVMNASPAALAKSAGPEISNYEGSGLIDYRYVIRGHTPHLRGPDGRYVAIDGMADAPHLDLRGELRSSPTSRPSSAA